MSERKVETDLQGVGTKQLDRIREAREFASQGVISAFRIEGPHYNLRHDDPGLYIDFVLQVYSNRLTTLESRAHDFPHEAKRILALTVDLNTEITEIFDDLDIKPEETDYPFWLSQNAIPSLIFFVERGLVDEIEKRRLYLEQILEPGSIESLLAQAKSNAEVVDEQKVSASKSKLGYASQKNKI